VPERIDYVWSDLPCSAAAVTLTHKTPRGCSLSDHFAVSAQLQLGAPRAAGAGAGGPGNDAAGSPARGGLGGLLKRAASGKAPAAAAAGGGGGTASPSPAAAAGLSDAAGRTALLGAAALLENGVLTASADTWLKTSIGGCCLVSVLYSAAALPFFMPWMWLGGWSLSLALVAVAVLVMGGLLLVLAGRVGDMAQQRALSNGYRQLRMFVEAHGVQLLPGEEGEGRLRQ
jgi:hypothetical protein